ncbi:protein transport protein S31 [Sporothrix curviconia]|uniref:Protein transport protein S31 n=1 Tax=Sporothrix curviconia TaxID=1260050 RepID=A0ABP0BGL3_9PEZI
MAMLAVGIDAALVSVINFGDNPSKLQMSVYLNLEEEIKEWSTLLDVTYTKNMTSTPQAGYTEMVFGDGTKFVAYSAEGVGHTVPVHPQEDLKWFGIA